MVRKDPGLNTSVYLYTVMIDLTRRTKRISFAFLSLGAWFTEDLLRLERGVVGFLGHLYSA